MKRDHCVEKRVLGILSNGYFKIYSRHDQLLFFQKQAPYAKLDFFFFILSHGIFNKVCQQKIHRSG